MLSIQKIEELAGGIDYHLKKLESMTSNLTEIKTTLEELRRSQEQGFQWELEKIRHELTDLKRELQKKGLNASQYESEYQTVKESILSPDWPLAVDPVCICNTEEMISRRARDILTAIIGERLEGKKFLDFGCGTGHVVTEALAQGAKAIGFDINSSKFQNQPFLTTDINYVIQNGPYDIILLHDVMDHLIETTPIALLNQLQPLLYSEGRLYIRCHPWSSRHGSHLYEQINKSFLHLVMDETELTRTGGWSCEHNLKIVNPLETYRNWFEQTNYKIFSEVPVRYPLENFFKKPSYAKDRMLRHWQFNEEAMYNSIDIDFVEYIVQATPIIRLS